MEGELAIYAADDGDEVSGGAVSAGAGLGCSHEGGQTLAKALGDPGLEPTYDVLPILLDGLG